MKRSVLITGTTSGIGRGLLEHYVREGWNVVSFNRREDPALESRFPAVHFVPIDVRDLERIQAYFREASLHNKLPELYYLNAGINKADSLESFSVEVFREVMEINLFGVLNFIHAALPYLEGRRATFVASSSTSNIFPNPNNLGYYVSKLAEEKIFRMLDRHYHKHGWSFKVLILSPIATPIFVDSKLASKLQSQIRNFLTVSVEEAVPRIVDFVESPRKVLYYTRLAAFVFSLAAWMKRLFPSFYQGSKADIESRARRPLPVGQV